MAHLQSNTALNSNSEVLKHFLYLLFPEYMLSLIISHHVPLLDRDVHSLVIHSVCHGHSGVYKCVISNKVGKAACYAHLYVAGKTELPLIYSSIVTFICVCLIYIVAS